MKWKTADYTPIDESWSDWQPFFAWYPVAISTDYAKHLYWLCRMERRIRKWRGNIWRDSVFTTAEYREKTGSTGGSVDE